MHRRMVAVRIDQREFSMIGPVGSDINGPHLGLLRRSQAEPQHIAAGQAGHGNHVFVIGVQYRGASGKQSLHDFAFRLCDAFAGAEFSKVSDADLQYDCRVRRCDTGQSRDFADMAGTHLSHEEPGVLIDPQRSERQADLIVERSHRSHGRAYGGKQGGEQILGGGLAHRTGQSDDVEVAVQLAAANDVVSGELAKGVDRVFHYDLRQAIGFHLMVDDGHRGSLSSGFRHKVMPIDTLASDGHKHRSWAGLPRVTDRIGGSRLRIGVADQSTIDGLGDLLHAHRNHGVSNSFTITLRPASTDLIEIIGHMQGTAYVVFPHAGGQYHGDGQGHVPESDTVVHGR